LAKLLKNHFEPKPLIIGERFTFHQQNQQVGDIVIEYLAELQRLATHCEFNDHLEEALCDRFVCGLKSEKIRNIYWPKIIWTLSIC